MEINLITNDEDDTIKVSYNDRIKDIKSKFQSWYSIPTYRQHFFYKDQELKDNKTLKDYKIQHGACIINKISKISKDDNSNSQQSEFQTQILPKSQQDQYQFKSQNEEANIIKITIKDNSGNFSTYMVKDDDTVFSLKVQISQQINVFPDHIELCINKKYLEDEGLINQYVNDNNSIIDLLTENDKNKIINLNFVNMNGDHHFSLKFVPRYSIRRLIHRTAELLNIKPHQINLFYNNIPLYESGGPIYDHCIHDGETIQYKIDKVLPGSFQIFVKNLTGKHITFYVSTTNKIS